MEDKKMQGLLKLADKLADAAECDVQGVRGYRDGVRLQKAYEAYYRARGVSGRFPFTRKDADS